MPTNPTLQKAQGTVSFRDLLSRIVTRLADALTASGLVTGTGLTTDPTAESVVPLVTITPDMIPVVAVPDDALPDVLTGGWTVRLRSPSPEPLSGGGRWSYMVTRVFDVFVVTESSVDAGRRDDQAVANHVAAEEAVYDAMLSFGAPGTPQGSAIPVMVKWVPGGDDIVRKWKSSPGLLVSCLCFELTYRAYTTVLRV